MSQLSNHDAFTALIARVEDTVIELDRTRTQPALETYQEAKRLLLDAIELVTMGERIAE